MQENKIIEEVVTKVEEELKEESKEAKTDFFNKLKEGVDKFIESEDFKNFTDKAKEVTEVAIEKAKEIKDSEQFQKIKNVAQEEVHKGAKAVNDFLAREDVNEKIEKAKDVTVDVAEKALNKLKKLLDRENKEND